MERTCAEISGPAPRMSSMLAASIGSVGTWLTPSVSRLTSRSRDVPSAFIGPVGRRMIPLMKFEISSEVVCDLDAGDGGGEGLWCFAARSCSSACPCFVAASLRVDRPRASACSIVADCARAKIVRSDACAEAVRVRHTREMRTRRDHRKSLAVVSI